MTITQIENWRDYQRDGGQFLKTARAAHRKESAAFSPSTCKLYENAVLFLGDGFIRITEQGGGEAINTYFGWDKVVSIRTIGKTE